MSVNSTTKCTGFRQGNLSWLSVAEISAIIEQCPNLCKQHYGQGDTDLVGIGVVFSYGIHLFLAILFSSVLIAEIQVIPSFRKRYNTGLFHRVLDANLDTCLWSSLLVALTVSLAGSVQIATNSLTGPYQGFAVMHAVAATYWSFLLVCVSYYKPIKRPVLFWFALFATTAFAITPFLVISTSAKGENVLQACLDYASMNDAAWKDTAIRPFDVGGRVHAGVNLSLVFIVLISWLVLRRSGDPEHLEGRQFKKRAVLVGIVVILSLYIAVDGIRFFVELLVIRAGMNAISDGETGVNKWGVGQTGAPFAWAPLVVDLCYKGMSEVQNWWADRQQTRQTQNRD